MVKVQQSTASIIKNSRLNFHNCRQTHHETLDLFFKKLFQISDPPHSLQNYQKPIKLYMLNLLFLLQNAKWSSEVELINPFNSKLSKTPSHVKFVILITKYKVEFRGSTLAKHNFCQSQQDAVWIFLSRFSDDPDTVKHSG